MSDQKKKVYLYDENADVTEYARKKFKKALKSTSKVDEESDDIDEQLSNCSQLNAQCFSSNKSLTVPECETRSNDNITEERGLQIPIQKFSNISGDEVEDEVRYHENVNEYQTMTELDQSMNQLLIDKPYDESPGDSSADGLPSSDEELTSEKDNEQSSSKKDNDQLKSNEFLEAISVNVEKSPGELLLMALKFSFSNNLSFTGITNVMQLINCICGEKILPETRYKINQLCNCDDNATLHSVCPTCTNYLGTFDNKVKTLNCECCNIKVDVSNPSDPSFFALIDPSDAIREYLQHHENYYDFIIRERTHEKNHIKDIYDGKAYRKFVKSLPLSDRYAYVTAIMNTDGAPVFKCSNYSIWPIYIMPNEIPVQDRFKSLIVAGLWFGKSKPDLSVILDKFVEQMNELSVVGITCKIKVIICRIKLFILLACVDTIARFPMNGTCQFNAFYGCDWCEHPGEYFEGSMRYPFLHFSVREREIK